MASSQPKLRGSAPLAKARERVRAIRRSLSASTNWLKAPALAEASSTDSASTRACSGATEPSGTMNKPPSAVAMMSTLMRSLKTPSTVRQCTPPRAAADSPADVASAVAGDAAVCELRFMASLRVSLPCGSKSGAAAGSAQLRPHKVERYFQLMK